MTKVVCSTFVIAMALMPQPAQACRTPISEIRFEISDVVIEGRATCLEIENQCEIEVDRVLKGDRQEIGSTLVIRVDDPPPLVDEDGMILIGHCPRTFEPWAREIEGRFYLTGRLPSRLYGAFPPDARELQARED